MFSSFQHMVATTKIDFEGRRPRSRQDDLPQPDGDRQGRGQAAHVFFCGLWYRDTFVRTDKGWRIKDRYEEKSFFHNYDG